jgi:hypothetical protein
VRFSKLDWLATLMFKIGTEKLLPIAEDDGHGICW